MLHFTFFTSYCFSPPCVGGRRNVCLSDSEDTLSAASDREVNNEVAGKNEGRRKTRAATQRHKKKESSRTERKITRGSRDTQTVCDESNPAPTSERCGQDASLKATQARKLLAKVWLARVYLWG